MKKVVVKTKKAVEINITTNIGIDININKIFLVSFLMRLRSKLATNFAASTLFLTRSFFS